MTPVPPLVDPVSLGDPELPPAPSGTDVQIVDDEPSCPACLVTPLGDPPTDPLSSGLWGVSSFYSEHVGAHQLCFVERGAARVGYVMDGGTQSGTYVDVTFRLPDNTGPVAFVEPAGLGYGAHPARSPSSSVTAFSALYLADAGQRRCAPEMGHTLCEQACLMA